MISTKGSRLAAGHDFYALTDGLVPAKGQVMVETGIAIGLLEGTYGRLAAGSGMATKMGIAVDRGVIDAHYTREVKVILRNHGQTDCSYKAGERIAQLIVERTGDANAIGRRRPRDNGDGNNEIWVKRCKPQAIHYGQRRRNQNMFSSR